MLDLGDSHNLIPKVVMDSIDLYITKNYKYLFSFDSRKVKCLGVIKDLVATLSQKPAKSAIMDVVMEDIALKL